MDCSTRINTSNNNDCKRVSRKRTCANMSSSRSRSSPSSYIWMMTVLVLSIMTVEQREQPFVNALKAPLRPKYTPKTSQKPSKQQHESLMRYANSAVEEGMARNAKPSSFQQRMKKLLKQQDNAAAKKKIVATRRRQQQASSITTAPPLVQDISTLEEFKDAVIEQDKLVSFV